MLQDTNISNLTENLIRVIQYHFSEQAPIIKVKSSNSSKPNISNETNNIIKKKDY